MIFNDARFFCFFLPLCMAGFWLFGRYGRRSAIGFLAFMSFVFYAQWSKIYVLLLAGSVLFNFFISRRIVATAGRERQQSWWLTAGIATNLAALCYFKYLFPLLRFAASFTPGHWSFAAVILPLGISFFTFTQIAYLVDLKQGAAQPENLLSYTFFVTFFPHLIAGPILHHKNIMPQVREERRYTLNSMDVALGLTWFGMGMFKKVVIADFMGIYADHLFSDVRHAGTADAWFGLLAYAFQLYFDFSGYSDMALGLARIFSIRFPFNFNSPYKASSIIDFWQRWHMTLTQYIMSYVYSPLLFAIRRRRTVQGKDNSRRTQASIKGFASMVALPTMFTMLVAGVWHGAGLQFFGYGVLHGFYLTVNHLWRTFVPAESRIQRIVNGPLAVLLTFLCVLMAFALFRANSLHDAFILYAGLLGAHGKGMRPGMFVIARYVFLLAIVWFTPNTQEILGQTSGQTGGQTGDSDRLPWVVFQPRAWQPSLSWLAAATVIWLGAVAWSTSATSFLYFQF